MYGEASWANVLLLVGLRQELLSEILTFLVRQEPANDVSAVYVEHHVELVVNSLAWTQQLGDIPRPDLVRAGSP